MRIRSIKPELWEMESFARVSRDARLLFVGLFSCCDDHGRARAASRFLASQIFAYDEDAISKLPQWLSELSREGFIRIYLVGSDHYLDIPQWLDYQKIDHPSKSKYPEFAKSSEVLASFCETLALEQGTGNRDMDQGIISDRILSSPPRKRRGLRADESEKLSALLALYAAEKNPDWIMCMGWDAKLKSSARARLKEFPDLDDWRDAMNQLKSENWIGRPGEHAQWRPNFAYFLRPGTIKGLLEKIQTFGKAGAPNQPFEEEEDPHLAPIDAGAPKNGKVQ